jgi:plasmid stabilization system protein ParE
MGYRTSLTSRAEDDAYAAFEFIRQHAPEAAERWLAGLFQAVFSLAEMPRRCPSVPEAYALDREVRHLLYGRGSATYRIIFDIDEASPEGPSVRVLRIWCGSRDRVRRGDLDVEESSLDAIHGRK